MFCWHCAASLPSLPPVVCPQCRTPHWLDPKPCASALVVEDGKLLMVRRNHDPWKGSWDVPGGFCGTNEHPSDTARREVREEVGLDIRITGLLGMWMDEYSPDAEGLPLKSTLNIYYHGTAIGRVGPVDEHEVAEVKWFLPGELPRDIAFPTHIAPVLRAWSEAFRTGTLTTPLYDVARND